MTKKQLKNMEDLDLLAEGWLYVDPYINVPSFNFKKLDAYCKKKGVKQPADLTEEERNQFLVRS
jgi:hypothetical protein